jgi:hypothetical protein
VPREHRLGGTHIIGARTHVTATMRCRVSTRPFLRLVGCVSRRRSFRVWADRFPVVAPPPHRSTHRRRHRYVATTAHSTDPTEPALVGQQISNDLAARSARGRVTDNAQASRQLGRAQRPVGAKQRTKHSPPHIDSADRHALHRSNCANGAVTQFRDRTGPDRATLASPAPVSPWGIRLVRVTWRAEAERVRPSAGQYAGSPLSDISSPRPKCLKDVNER